jgi:hypothetical protein
MEPMLSLSLIFHANQGRYAVLIGSVVSRSAGIPTGWKVVIDLILRVAALRREDCETKGAKQNLKICFAP